MVAAPPHSGNRYTMQEHSLPTGPVDLFSPKEGALPLKKRILILSYKHADLEHLWQQNAMSCNPF